MTATTEELQGCAAKFGLDFVTKNPPYENGQIGAIVAETPQLGTIPLQRWRYVGDNKWERVKKCPNP